MNDPSAMSTTCRRILLSVSFLIIQAHLLAFAQPTINRTICIYNGGNYTASNDSTYRANLNTALSTLSTNVDINGFYNASVGQNPNRVNAIILCRGDILLDECRSCLQTATDELLRVCPNQKQAVIYIGNCTLRYSNETLIGTVTTGPKAAYNNFNNASNAGNFKESLAQLLDNLRVEAADGGPMRKVAAANATPTAPSFETIYAFVQCTPDLSEEDCSSCLGSAAREITLCCYNRVGAVILFPSCNLRYEIYPFYNETRLWELGPRVAPAPPVVPAPPPGKDDGNTNRIVIIIAVSAVAVLILAVLIGILLRKRMKRKPFKKLETVDDISTVESLQYTFSTIQVATNDFSDSNKLGEGGFGAVYKGKLSDDREIAVKRLSKNSGQGDLEFKNEVLLLSRLQHRNLVRLLGFCIEGTEKLLVYEFVQNTSLDLFIFDQTNDQSYLDWERRYKIIGGIAKGILYLHEDSRLRIIHRDLKTSNILLDGQLNPKIADFGMARLFGQDETQGNTSRIVGTHGYMAPEYVMYGQFSIKSDVFSFGVLVLEIISGQKNNCFQSGNNVENLLSFAWRNWREGSVTSMLDPILIRSGSGSMNDILRCIHIGLLCVQENEADRPTMASVVLMLSSFSITLAVPSEPAFYMDRSGHDSEVVAGMQEFNSIDILANNNSSKSYNGGAQSDHSSNNNASFTITELDPR